MMKNPNSKISEIKYYISSKKYQECLLFLDEIKTLDSELYVALKLDFTRSFLLRRLGESGQPGQIDICKPSATEGTQNLDIKSIDINSNTQKNPNLRGDINKINDNCILTGWIFKENSLDNISGFLKIDNEFIQVKGECYRQDLYRNGIGNGKHGFQCKLPNKYFDNTQKTIRLFDFDKTKILSEKSFIFASKRDKNFDNFESFLEFSLTSSLVEGHFAESDKRVFATMEELSFHLERKALNLHRKPLVSIIMPVYNREKIVERSIESVLQQSYPNYELIIVDDCSEDNSLQVISRFQSDKIKVIALPENSGVSHARNIGLAQSRGEYIAYLDSDNTWDSRFIACNLGAFVELKDAEFVYSGCFLYRGTDSHPSGYRYGHFNKSLLENRNYIDNNTIFHKKSCLERLVGYDTDLQRFVDWDFALRASEQCRMYSIPVILCNYYYDLAENTITKNARLLGYQKHVLDKMCSRRLNLMKHESCPKLETNVSVIIPSWEALPDLKDCLNSLISLSIFRQLEVLIIDNNSSPGVKEYLQKISREHSNIFVKYLDCNYGFTYAINKGIEAANSSNDVLLLNNDACVLEGAIQRLQTTCVNDVQVAVPMQILPAHTESISTHVPSANIANYCDVNLSSHHRNVINLPLFSSGDNFDLNYAPFFAVYFKRELLVEAGALNASSGRHYRSDRVYCNKVRLIHRSKIRYVYDARVMHKLQASTQVLRGSDKNAFNSMFEKNQWEPELANQLNYTPFVWDI